MTFADWRKVLSINLDGTLPRHCRAVARAMRHYRAAAGLENFVFARKY